MTAPRTAAKPDVAIDDDLTAAHTALREVGRRSSVARRLQGGVEQRLLQSIVDATVSLFDAEGASISLFETDPDRLEVRVAAGAQGAGAIGLSVKPTEGIAGFVYATGQALAVTDAASDPRFDLEAAQKTGYVPRSLAAVPLLDDEGSVGVLEVLDKRGSPSFTLRDMELLAIFARQATTAITATRLQRDTARMLAEVLRQLAGKTLTDEQVEVLVSEATRGMDDHPDEPFWQLVDSVEQIRGLGERNLALVAQILEVVARHAQRAHRRA